VIDLNDNGVEDYKEPWLWRSAWTVIAFLVKALAPSHTIIRRGVEAVDPIIRSAQLESVERSKHA